MEGRRVKKVTKIHNKLRKEWVRRVREKYIKGKSIVRVFLWLTIVSKRKISKKTEEKRERE